MKPLIIDRPIANAVQSALNDSSYGGASARVLAAEVIALRACIERCKSVQRMSETYAKESDADAIEEPSSVSSMPLAIAYQSIATELAKALEGF